MLKVQGDKWPVLENSSIEASLNSRLYTNEKGDSCGQDLCFNILNVAKDRLSQYSRAYKRLFVYPYYQYLESMSLDTVR